MHGKGEPWGSRYLVASIAWEFDPELKIKMNVCSDGAKAGYIGKKSVASDGA